MLRPWFFTYTSALVPDFTMDTTTDVADWKLVSQGLQAILAFSVQEGGTDGSAPAGAARWVAPHIADAVPHRGVKGA